MAVVVFLTLCLVAEKIWGKEKKCKSCPIAGGGNGFKMKERGPNICGGLVQQVSLVPLGRGAIQIYQNP